MVDRPPRIAFSVCCVLLVLFAVTSWRAVGTKSPTYDEPYHAPSAWVALHRGDYRIDCEDPPLWKYWAALPNGRDALSADFDGEIWRSIPQNQPREWYWCVTTLYRTPGNDAEAFINRSRAMMLALGAGLGAMLAWWAWRLKGAVAAIVATGLFSLDPNFLAHAPLVKNDVVFSLAMLALAFALWRAGQRLTWPRAIALALLCAVMLTVKFSGVLAAVLVSVMLSLRALVPVPWPALGRDRSTLAGKLAVSASVTVLCGATSIAGIWAAYGFRFEPTPEPGVRIDTATLARMAAANEAIARGQPPDPTAPPSAFVRANQFAEAHHLLPQSWLAGLLFTYQASLVRQAFLFEQTSPTGWWYYFPLAMLIKTPIATTLAIAGATIVILAAFRGGSGRSWDARWTIASQALPFTVYLVSAMRGNLNIGVRHVLPIYPLMFIAAGCAAAHAVQQWRRKAIVVLSVLGVALAIETLSVVPDFLSFCNLAAGGSVNGIHLLGDSNLDWGQDLKLLAAWQQKHAEMPLYLAYFGLADPHYYGINYTPLPGGYHYDPKPAFPHGICTVAVSATYLQGLLVDPELHRILYGPLAARKPTEILGGSIYLYAISAQ